MLACRVTKHFTQSFGPFVIPLLQISSRQRFPHPIAIVLKKVARVLADFGKHDGR